MEYGDAMGATFSVVLYGHDRAEMEAAIDAAFAEVARLDAMLSNYRAESEWSEVNRRAPRSPSGFRRSCSSCFRHASHTAGRAKEPSILRWDR